MNIFNRNPSKSRAAGVPAVSAINAAVEHHFGALVQEPLVEHLTVPGFFRRIEHPWTMDDIRRFGHQVGHVAEAMQLAYLTRTDALLGVLRAFPEPLLTRIYEIMRLQNGWPALVDEVEDEAHKLRCTLRAAEKASQQMQDLITETDDLDDLGHLQVAAKILEGKIATIRARMAVPTSAAPAAPPV